MANEYQRYFNLLVNRMELERELEQLIGERGTDETAAALKAIALTRAAEPQSMSERQASEYAAESAYAAAQRKPEPTPGIHDKRCRELMPDCICLRCREDHSDGTSICCVEHAKKCREAECKDYKNSGGRKRNEIYDG